MELDKFYHTSALVATSLSTLTSPYRLKQDVAHISSMVSGMVLRNDLKLNCLSSSFPLPRKPMDVLFKPHEYNARRPLHTSEFMACLTAELPVVETWQGRLYTECGIVLGASNLALSPATSRADMLRTRPSSKSAMFRTFMESTPSAMRKQGYVVEKSIHTPQMFPNKRDIPDSNPCCATAYASANVGTVVEAAAAGLKTLSSPRGLIALYEGLDVDDVGDGYENLLAAANSYDASDAMDEDDELDM